jgi:uncharacterized membrane protein HdeD (DUF308 family)
MEASTGTGFTFSGSTHWWMLAALGIFQVIGGLVALVFTGVTLLALGIIFGVNLLFSGMLMVFVGIGDESASTGVKILRIVIGVLTELAGLICIVRPGASVLVLLLCMSFFFLLSGTMWIAQAAAEGDHRILNFILGLLGIAAGIVVVGNPDVGLQTLADLAGIVLIVRGMFELMAGLYMRRTAT